MIKTNPPEMPNGFHIAFSNGYSISVQWGAGTYSDNQHLTDIRQRAMSKCVEVAAFGRDGKMIGDPKGWVDVDDLPAIMKDVSSWT